MNKHSVTIRGHRTSVSIETEFWTLLCQRADEQSMSLNALVTQIDAGRGSRNLSSAIRLYVLESLKQRADSNRSA